MEGGNEVKYNTSLPITRFEIRDVSKSSRETNKDKKDNS